MPDTLAGIQQAFTRHIRDPEHEPAPGDIESRRMEIYRSSIFLNIDRMVSNFFPILKKILPDDHWHAMVRDYFRQHRSQVPPLLPRLGQEFLEYLEHERDLSADPPFLLELAHYEWIVFALSIDPKVLDWTGVDPDGDLLEGIPVLSQLAVPLSYRFPVHAISPGGVPDSAPDERTYIVAYRDRELKTGFIKLNPVSARLLALIREQQGLSGRALLEQIAAELRHPNPDVVIQGGAGIMQEMRAKDVLLGTREG